MVTFDRAPELLLRLQASVSCVSRCWLFLSLVLTLTDIYWVLSYYFAIAPREILHTLGAWK